MRKEKRQLQIGNPRVYVDWLTVQFPGHWLLGKGFQQFRYGAVRMIVRGPVARLVLEDSWLRCFDSPDAAVLSALFVVAAKGVFGWPFTVHLSAQWWRITVGYVLWEDVFDQLKQSLGLVELTISADVPGIPYAGDFEIGKVFRMSRKSAFYTQRDFVRYRRPEGSARHGEGRGRQDSFFSVHLVSRSACPAGLGFKVKLHFSGKYRRHLHMSVLSWRGTDLIDAMLPTSRAVLFELGVPGAWVPNPLALFVQNSALPRFLQDLGCLGASAT